MRQHWIIVTIWHIYWLLFFSKLLSSSHHSLRITRICWYSCGITVYRHTLLATELSFYGTNPWENRKILTSVDYYYYYWMWFHEHRHDVNDEEKIFMYTRALKSGIFYLLTLSSWFELRCDRNITIQAFRYFFVCCVAIALGICNAKYMNMEIKMPNLGH